MSALRPEELARATRADRCRCGENPTFLFDKASGQAGFQCIPCNCASEFSGDVETAVRNWNDGVWRCC